MVALVWPKDHLPRAVLIAGYKVSQTLPLVRTPMEGGIARQRKRFSAPPARIPVQWMMTADQVAIFKSWLAYKAAYGGAFFSMELLLDNGIQYYDVRFVSSGSDDVSYTPVAGGKHWLVQSSIEVKAPTPLTEEVVDLVLGTGAEAAVYMASFLEAEEPILTPAIDEWGAVFGA